MNSDTEKRIAISRFKHEIFNFPDVPILQQWLWKFPVSNSIDFLVFFLNFCFKQSKSWEWITWKLKINKSCSLIILIFIMFTFIVVLLTDIRCRQIEGKRDQQHRTISRYESSFPHRTFSNFYEWDMINVNR